MTGEAEALAVVEAATRARARATDRAAIATAAWREAITAANAAGARQKVIADRAGCSLQRVKQIVAGKP